MYTNIILFIGVVNGHYSCLTWELNGNNLSLICRIQNQVEPVSFIDSKGNLKAKCTLNNPSKCETFQIHTNTTANIYKNEVVFMINDYEQTRFINDEWTCLQGNRTLKTVVSTSKGKRILIQTHFYFTKVQKYVQNLKRLVFNLVRIRLKNYI